MSERLAGDPRVTVRHTGPPDPDGTCIVYCMQRAVDNPALDLAIDLGNELRRPVHPQPDTLDAVRRLTALLLALALVVATAQLSALHVHVYEGDHQHDHHHGFAAHSHHRPAAPAHDHGPSLGACDPAQHQLSLILTWTTRGHERVPVATPAARLTVTTSRTVSTATGPSDVRVHGPPPRVLADPRAPPPSFPA